MPTSASTTRPFEADAFSVPRSRIDQLVFDRLAKLGIEPSKPCSDAVFVRRVYLDVIGELPTAQEAGAFLQDKTPNKRQLLVDSLLSREEYADYWAMKWCDLLRVKAEFPINLWPKAAQTYHRWIRTAIKENRPYDQFARELLLASGTNFYDPPANFYRALQNKQPQDIAKMVALTFMGERADKWPKARLAGLAAFFSQLSYKGTQEWKEEIVFLDPSKPFDASATFPDGTPAKVQPLQDPREVLAGWLVSDKNPSFSRNMVNRVWYWLLGRGIVQEPDDIRADNPPANPELLDYLQQEFVSSHYDLKHVYRLILNSQTYQLSSIHAGNDPLAAANFAFYPLRQLEAEVVIDALCQITGSTEKYSSLVPEPFIYVPEDERTVATADGNTTSSFLETFGRPARDSGLLTERNASPSAGQRLYMLNSSHIGQKIERSRKLGQLAPPRSTPREVINALYLTILSRYPTDAEFQVAAGYARQSRNGNRELMVDLAWALINGEEFIYRH